MLTKLCVEHCNMLGTKKTISFSDCTKSTVPAVNCLKIVQNSGQALRKRLVIALVNRAVFRGLILMPTVMAMKLLTLDYSTTGLPLLLGEPRCDCST